MRYFLFLELLVTRMTDLCYPFHLSPYRQESYIPQSLQGYSFSLYHLHQQYGQLIWFFLIIPDLTPISRLPGCAFTPGKKMPFLPGSTGKCLPYSSNIPFVMSERTYRGTLVQVVYAIDPYLTFVEHDKICSPHVIPQREGLV